MNDDDKKIIGGYLVLILVLILLLCLAVFDLQIRVSKIETRLENKEVSHD